VESSTQDFTSQAQKIASDNPDTVVMLLTGPTSITFLDQLRNAGYKKQVLASTSQSSGALTSAGSSAEGLVMPVDFSPSFTNDVAKKFVKEYQEKFNKLPPAYASDGYTAMWWIARAIKQENSSASADIQKGLLAVGKTGFDSAPGAMTFEKGQDARVKGGIVTWKNGKEQLIQ
jgi:branched-chain amino acid transport system substrate-binding protein